MIYSFKLFVTQSNMNLVTVYHKRDYLPCGCEEVIQVINLFKLGEYIIETIQEVHLPFIQI